LNSLKVIESRNSNPEENMQCASDQANVTMWYSLLGT